MQVKKEDSLWINADSDRGLKNIDYLMIETTNYCNLDCSFCNRREIMKTTPLKHMEIDKFKKIMEIFKNNKITRTKLQGMGEPYLHPRFPELVEMFREYFPDTFLICATNCQYNKLGEFDRVIKHINLQYISVDGLKENYEKFRKGASWGKLISFLEHISLQDYSKKCSINFVATHENYKDIPGVIKLGKEYNLGEPRINIAQEWDENKTGKFGGDPNFIEFLKRYKKYVIGIADWEYKDCYWPSKGAYIDALGNVRMCPVNTSGKPFGNIGDGNPDEMKKRLIEIRGSERFKGIHEGILNNNPTKYCKTCDYPRLAPILKKILYE